MGSRGFQKTLKKQFTRLFEFDIINLSMDKKGKENMKINLANHVHMSIWYRYMPVIMANPRVWTDDLEFIAYMYVNV